MLCTTWREEPRANWQRWLLTWLTAMVMREIVTSNTHKHTHNSLSYSYSDDWHAMGEWVLNRDMKKRNGCPIVGVCYLVRKKMMIWVDTMHSIGEITIAGKGILAPIWVFHLQTWIFINKLGISIVCRKKIHLAFTSCAWLIVVDY